MKIVLLWTLLMFASVMFADCNQRGEPKESDCVVPVINDPRVIEASERLRDIDSFARELDSIMPFDTLYFFDAYTSRETVIKHVSCYDKAFDKITVDDAANLLIFERKGLYRHMRVVRRNILFDQRGYIKYVKDF